MDGGTTETTKLLHDYAAGDRDALGRLLDRYRGTVERIVRVRLGWSMRARMDVGDVVQNAMAKAIQGIEHYAQQEDARFVHWLSRIAQNAALEAIRHEGAARRDPRREAISPREAEPGFDPQGETTSIPERALRAERKDILDDCLSQLSEPHREVILLRDYAGASWEYTAEALERPSVGAAQQLHARARLALKEKLAPRLGSG